MIPLTSTSCFLFRHPYRRPVPPVVWLVSALAISVQKRGIVWGKLRYAYWSKIIVLRREFDRFAKNWAFHWGAVHISVLPVFWSWDPGSPARFSKKRWKTIKTIKKLRIVLKTQGKLYQKQAKPLKHILKLRNSGTLRLRSWCASKVFPPKRKSLKTIKNKGNY